MKKLLLFLAMVTVSVATWAQEKKDTIRAENVADDFFPKELADKFNYDELEGEKWFYEQGSASFTKECIYFYDFGTIISIKYLPKEEVATELQKKLSYLKSKGNYGIHKDDDVTAYGTDNLYIEYHTKQQ